MSVWNFFLDWLNLSIRWGHFTVGVAWIGASFYFNWLEGRLNRAGNTDPQLAGDLWAVHGGGFYHVRKFALNPEPIPAPLHWFKWEAYATWLTGMALLAVVYYANASAMLLNPDLPLPVTAAVAIGLGVLAAGWLVYDRLDATSLAGRPGLFALLGLVLLTVAAWGLGQVFNPRAAYIHVGALIGTLMVGNVFRVIIPAQRDLVDAALAGRSPDPERARQAGRRSRHNNYLTLPVLFIMVSNHYPFTYGHRWSWAVLAGLSVLGVGVRHYFNLRHDGRARAWMLIAAVVAYFALAALVTEWPGPPQNGAGGTVDVAQVRAVIARRCAPCHAASPSQPGFTAPPGGIAFDRDGVLEARSRDILQQAVTTKVMPPGNLTGITDAERKLLGRWAAGR